MKEIILETERLQLKTITPTLVHDLFNTKTKDEIMNFFGFNEQGFEKYRDMHEKGMETYQLSFLFFLLIEKQTSQPIGECGFHTWHKKHDRAELFYSLRNDSDKRKGYMTEAIAFVLKYGFEQMNLHRVEALIAEWNEPSLKLINKYGFTKEGIMREDYFENGRHEDSICYSLLANEYKSTL
jgi:ribosomal-protein-alanine N-acetyltransferase